MKVVVPLAGKGTRLLPLTKHTPKPLVRVAGRPVLDYVLDRLEPLDVDELIFITGHLKEKVESHVRETCRHPARFVEQVVQDGTAGAVNLARPHIDGPVLIFFVDTLFETDLTVIDAIDADGIMWVKEVEDYQRFGVVVTDEHGNMTRIIEKPSEPVSKLANIGLYYVRDWKLLFEGIEHTLRQPKNQGEWFLTDAFQYMIDHGSRLRTVPVDGWFDCGKVDTLLDTNRYLLEHGRARPFVGGNGTSVVEPVRVGEGVRIENSKIGPNVTLEENAVVRGSVVRDTIVGRGARITDSDIAHSLIGDGASVTDTSGVGFIAAGDEIRETDAP